MNTLTIGKSWQKASKPNPPINPLARDHWEAGICCRESGSLDPKQHLLWSGVLPRHLDLGIGHGAELARNLSSKWLLKLDSPSRQSMSLGPTYDSHWRSMTGAVAWGVWLNNITHGTCVTQLHQSNWNNKLHDDLSFPIKVVELLRASLDSNASKAGSLTVDARGGVPGITCSPRSSVLKRWKCRPCRKSQVSISSSFTQRSAWWMNRARF